MDVEIDMMIMIMMNVVLLHMKSHGKVRIWKVVACEKREHIL
jgi:hypothetical protein